MYAGCVCYQEAGTAGSVDASPTGEKRNDLAADAPVGDQYRVEKTRCDAKRQKRHVASVGDNVIAESLEEVRHRTRLARESDRHRLKDGGGCNSTADWSTPRQAKDHFRGLREALQVRAQTCPVGSC